MSEGKKPQDRLVRAEGGTPANPEISATAWLHDNSADNLNWFVSRPPQRSG